MKKTILIVFISLVACVMIYKSYKNSEYEYYSKFNVSESISQSKSRGVFIKKIAIKPDTFTYKNNKISINESWVEYRSFVKYFLLFFRKRKKVNEYTVCFTTNDNAFFYANPKFFFVKDDRDIGVGKQIDAKNKKIIFYFYVANFKKKNFSLSIMSSMNEKARNYILLTLDN